MEELRIYSTVEVEIVEARRGACASLFFFNYIDTHNTHAKSHPYEYTYANPTPMNTSEGLSTGRSGNSRSHQWRLIVDGNVAYHLTHNAGKSWKIQEKVRAPRLETWWPNRTCAPSSPPFLFFMMKHATCSSTLRGTSTIWPIEWIILCRRK
jgi:hypothetical protein